MRSRRSCLRAFRLVGLLTLFANPSVAHGDPLGVPVCTAPGTQRRPAITLDETGATIVAWEDGRNPDGTFDIYAQRLYWGNSSGWPSDGVPICTVRGNQRNPQVVADGNEGFYVLWEDSRSGDWDIYARRVLASTGTSAPGWPDSGLALCKVVGDQIELVATSDGLGGAIAAWRDLRTGEFPPFTGPGVYARRITGSGLSLGWSGSTSGRLIGSPGRDPSVVRDPEGGAFIASSGTRTAEPTTPASVWVSRVDTLGQFRAGWISNGNRVSRLAGDKVQIRPRLAPHDGGVFVAWEDTSVVCISCVKQSDLWSQVFEGDGTRRSRAAIAQATDAQRHVAIAEVPGNGGHLFWEDWTFYPKIHASRFFAAAQPQPLDGVQAGPGATAEQDSAAAAADLDGGAFVAWQDFRHYPSTNADIYVQHFESSGAKDPAWPAAGVRLLGGAGYDGNPRVVVDIGGAAQIVWDDRRNGNADIYFQRVGLDGSLGSLVDAGDEVPRGGVPVRIVPNPSPGVCRIQFVLSRAGSPRLEVYDVQGRLRRVLLDGRTLPVGPHSVAWDGADDRGDRMEPGIYFIRTIVDREASSRKFVLLP